MTETTDLQHVADKPVDAAAPAAPAQDTSSPAAAAAPAADPVETKSEPAPVSETTKLAADLGSVLKGMPGRAWAELSARKPVGAERLRKPAMMAGALALAVAVGFGGGRATGSRAEAPDGSAQRLAEATNDLHQTGETLTHVGSELKALRTSVDTLKGERDRTRGELIARQDRTEKSAADAASRLGKLSEQTDRIEKAQRDPARLNTLLERMERLEAKLTSAQVAATPTPPPKPVAATTPAADPVQTGSLPDPRAATKVAEAPDPRRTQLEGYVLRDIDDGMALVESRSGRLYELSPGMTLPGIGKVEGVERRGRHWILLTPKGFIAER